MTAVELLPSDQAVHGNERWHELRRAGITASEIAIVLGISPYGSPFSLYWQKVCDWRDDGNVYTSTGRHLEPAIAEWWQAEHGRYVAVCPAGLYAHTDRPWQLATPDRLICDPQMHDNPFPDEPAYDYDHFTDADHLALLECKWVAYSWDGWGPDGSDEIPAYYRAQVLWQCDVLGVDEWHLAVLGPGGFRAYHGQRDDNDLKVMRDAGAEFVQRMADGDPPDLDSHSATLTTLKRLHPTVGDGDVECTPDLAERYRYARSEKKAFEEYIAGCEAEIRAALGSDFARVVCDGRVVASRSVFEQQRIDAKRLRAEQREMAAAYTTTTLVDRLSPGRNPHA